MQITALPVVTVQLPPTPLELLLLDVLVVGVVVVVVGTLVAPLNALPTPAAEPQEVINSAEISNANDRITFFINHPFKFFFYPFGPLPLECVPAFSVIWRRPRRPISGHTHEPSNVPIIGLIAGDVNEGTYPSS